MKLDKEKLKNTLLEALLLSFVYSMVLGFTFYVGVKWCEAQFNNHFIEMEKTSRGFTYEDYLEEISTGEVTLD